MSNWALKGAKPSLVEVLTHLARAWRSCGEQRPDEQESYATRVGNIKKFLTHPIRTLFELIEKRTKISTNDLEWMSWYIDVRPERTPPKIPEAVFVAEPTGDVYDTLPSDTPSAACVQYLCSLYEDMEKLDGNGGTLLILRDFEAAHPGVLDAILAETAGQPTGGDATLPSEPDAIATAKKVNDHRRPKPRKRTTKTRKPASVHLPVLTPTDKASLAIIKAKKGKGMVAKEIVIALANRGFSINQGTFRRHIVPKLKAHGVKNNPARGGYYDSTCLNGT